MVGLGVELVTGVEPVGLVGVDGEVGLGVVGVEAVVEGDGEGEVEDPVGQVPTAVHCPSFPHCS